MLFITRYVELRKSVVRLRDQSSGRDFSLPIHSTGVLLRKATGAWVVQGPSTKLMKCNLNKLLSQLQLGSSPLGISPKYDMISCETS